MFLMQKTRLSMQLWREKLPNTRPVSQAAGCPQVLHVMVSQEKTAVVETNPCGGEKCAWFSLKAGEQSRWSSVRTCPALCLATETRHRSELSIKETEYYEANNRHLSQDACQGGWSLQDKGWMSQIHLAGQFNWLEVAESIHSVTTGCSSTCLTSSCTVIPLLHLCCWQPFPVVYRNIIGVVYPEDSGIHCCGATGGMS